jgi:hypothetical protein
VPAKGTPGKVHPCAVDEHVRLECGASNFKLAASLKDKANAAFRAKDYGAASELYEEALERAGTCAYSSQFAGIYPCDTCMQYGDPTRCTHGVHSTGKQSHNKWHMMALFRLFRRPHPPAVPLPGRCA